MTAVWTNIPDAWVAANAPVTTQLMTALRDNVEGFAYGVTGAPNMQTSMLAPGGSGADGALINATTMTAPGYYDFTTGTVTTAKALPWFSVLRFQGNLTLSATLTVDAVPANVDPLLFGVRLGNAGAEATADTLGSGGGGHHGAGGEGSNTGAAGGAARSLSSLKRWWLSKDIPTGGPGGAGYLGSSVAARPGGVCVIIVGGNLVMTGGTITAPGAIGASAASGAGGGAGGGTVIVLCAGTITGGTILVPGGAGGSEVSGANTDGGGGSGGAAVMVAPAWAGSQTLTAAGGSGPGTAADGAAGYTEQTTLIATYLNGLLVR